MKLNITIDFDAVNGLDYDSITTTINEVVDEEVRKEARVLVRVALAKHKQQMVADVTKAMESAVQKLLGT